MENSEFVRWCKYMGYKPHKFDKVEGFTYFLKGTLAIKEWFKGLRRAFEEFDKNAISTKL